MGHMTYSKNNKRALLFTLHSALSKLDAVAFVLHPDATPTPTPPLVLVLQVRARDPHQKRPITEVKETYLHLVCCSWLKYIWDIWNIYVTTCTWCDVAG